MEECKVQLKKIVAALDLSAYSETTFAHALTLAESLGAELVILNVVNIAGLHALDLVRGQGLISISREDYINNTQTERTKLFTEQYISRAGSVPVRVESRVGVPFEEVLKFLRQEKADMVVLGTKGRTNLAGVLFGSTAEKVYRHAPCVVVSVRGPEHCRLPN